MARLVAIALCLACAATSALAQPMPASSFSIPPGTWRVADDGQTRNFRPGNVLSDEYEGSDFGIMAGTDVSPNATVGLGMFGLRQEQAHHAPVTGRELGAPRTRMPGLGLRLKF
jgi:hypothetical protein